LPKHLCNPARKSIPFTIALTIWKIS
jgi:hypothetical protein